ncbi:MAG: glycosyltransferase family 2 protein [Chloroherpetonaceae bacterium]|nr:glycosyltransferase family 2 protein [Chloroherpetonaceae bacterium]MCS7210028.1 glycosyltransferase family 2 protein [Chloroherpetonaceae bacterium]MDW8019345.1 glycosyltransferase family 2 protein [Chloroherpetonaceae bacterium]
MLEHYPSVIILLLNWNGWCDTIECLESVFRLNYPNYRVIVCDNGSTDDSPAYIKAWAEGRYHFTVPPESPLSALPCTPIAKPIAYLERTLAQTGPCSKQDEPDAKLTLIQVGKNLGFAGGNNVGLSYALSYCQFDYIWLLNSDTVVLPDTLTRLIEAASKDCKIGLCGSTVLYYHNPSRIQTLGGGRYHKWFGLTSHIAEEECLTDIPAEMRCRLAASMDYVMGASMLVSRNFLETVGLMSEEYFLYFEELDWAMRAKGRFRLGYAVESIVYHKSGRSVGNTPKEWSPTSVFHTTRSRIKFVRKFYPAFLPIVYVRLLLSLFNQWRKGQCAQAQAIWKAMRHQ